MRFSNSVLAAVLLALALVDARASEFQLNARSVRFVDSEYKGHLRGRANTPPTSPVNNQPGNQNPPATPQNPGTAPQQPSNQNVPATPQNQGTGTQQPSTPANPPRRGGGRRAGPPLNYLESPMSPDRPAAAIAAYGTLMNADPNARISEDRKMITIGNDPIASQYFPSYPKTGRGKNFNTVASRVQKYYHAASIDPDDWSIIKGPVEEMKWVQVPLLSGQRPATPDPDEAPARPGHHWVQEPEIYQTEHVLEAQTDEKFFGVWLRTQATPRRDKVWVQRWFVTQKDATAWPAPGRATTGVVLPPNPNNAAFSFVLELGSRLVAKQNRLTVLLAGVNNAKGKLFDPVVQVAIAPSTFNRDYPTTELQLLRLKDMGMVFTYMAHRDVWGAFCSTFQAKHQVLTRFDTWYNKKNPAAAKSKDKSNIAEEWGEYVRAELDAVVAKALSNINALTQARASKTPAFPAGEVAEWTKVVEANKRLIKFDLPCANLPASRPRSSGSQSGNIPPTVASSSGTQPGQQQQQSGQQPSGQQPSGQQPAGQRPAGQQQSGPAPQGSSGRLPLRGGNPGKRPQSPSAGQ